MATLTEGYFPATYFPATYWTVNPQYWPEYGTAVEPEAPELPAHSTQYHPVTRVRRKRLNPRVLELIKEYLEHKLNDGTD